MVPMGAPARDAASMTVTLRPLLCSHHAVARPEMPAPMTSTSDAGFMSFECPSGAGCKRAPFRGGRSGRGAAGLKSDRHVVDLVLQANALFLHVLDGEIPDRNVGFFQPFDLVRQPVVLAEHGAEPVVLRP